MVVIFIDICGKRDLGVCFYNLKMYFFLGNSFRKLKFKGNVGFGCFVLEKKKMKLKIFREVIVVFLWMRVLER